MRIRIMTLLLLSLLLIISTPFCSANYRIEADAVRFDTPYWEKDEQGNTVFLVGTLQNVSGRELSAVMVNYKFFNKDNIQIGTNGDGVYNLAVNDIARYKIIVPKGVYRAEIIPPTIYAK